MEPVNYPGSREVLSPMNLVLEPPACLAPQTLNVSLLIATAHFCVCLSQYFWTTCTSLIGHSKIKAGCLDKLIMHLQLSSGGFA